MVGVGDRLLLRAVCAFGAGPPCPCREPPSLNNPTAPQAAGIAALVRSVNPRLRADQIERLMFENTTAVGAGLLIPDTGKTVLAAKQTAP